MGEISRSMQLIAGRTAQQYNTRKSRKGAFWDDRYYATAIESGRHLAHCMVYIDLNMVRAGAVEHPAQWAQSGYREIQSPPMRYRIIDIDQLRHVLGYADSKAVRKILREAVQSVLDTGNTDREALWTESVAVGGRKFVEQIKSDLASDTPGRKVAKSHGRYSLREEKKAYRHDFGAKMGTLSAISAT